MRILVTIPSTRIVQDTKTPAETSGVVWEIERKDKVPHQNINHTAAAKTEATLVMTAQKATIAAKATTTAATNTAAATVTPTPA